MGMESDLVVANITKNIEQQRNTWREKVQQEFYFTTVTFKQHVQRIVVLLVGQIMLPPNQCTRGLN